MRMGTRTRKRVTGNDNHVQSADLVCISYIPNEPECCCILDRTIKYQTVTDIRYRTSPSLDPLCICTTPVSLKIKKGSFVQMRRVLTSRHPRISDHRHRRLLEPGRARGLFRAVAAVLYQCIIADLWHRTNTQSVWPFVHVRTSLRPCDGDLEPERNISFDVSPIFPAWPSWLTPPAQYSTIQYSMSGQVQLQFVRQVADVRAVLSCPACLFGSRVLPLFEISERARCGMNREWSKKRLNPFFFV